MMGKVRTELRYNGHCIIVTCFLYTDNFLFILFLYLFLFYIYFICACNISSNLGANV